MLVILPTGAGKSICFQVPALLHAGLTLVVSPLVSLMENQVAELRERQIPAALLHSQISKQDRQDCIRRIEARQLKLLYLAPETLLSQSFWPRLPTWANQISLLIIDEAHCLLQWGTTFRPIYRRLGSIRPALPKASFGIGAFTATADPGTAQEIQRVLGLRSPRIVRESPYRPNLALKISIAWSDRSRRQRLLNFIRAQGETSGLVYIRSRREGEELTQWLTGQGCPCLAYHAGLSAQTRRRIEQQWLTGQTQFVICTSAFGMGINKPDVRWVCHFHPPLSLSEYLQEIGRAGRDAQPAQAWMLVSEPTGWLDPYDRQQRQYFHQERQDHYRHALRLAKRLPQSGHIPALTEIYPQAEMALSLLHSLGQVIWTGPLDYRIRPTGKGPAGFSKDEGEVQSMRRFIQTRQCRWQFILQTFGFEARLPCGHCDRCGLG